VPCGLDYDLLVYPRRNARYIQGIRPGPPALSFVSSGLCLMELGHSARGIEITFADSFSRLLVNPPALRSEEGKDVVVV